LADGESFKNNLFGSKIMVVGLTMVVRSSDENADFWAVEGYGRLAGERF
jgi:hypothetical protein